MFAHVVGEHLVNDDRGHEHGHEHAEGEELAGRGLVDPVVDFSGQNLVACRARHQAAASPQLSQGFGEGARPDFEETVADLLARGKAAEVDKILVAANDGGISGETAEHGKPAHELDRLVAQLPVLAPRREAASQNRDGKAR